MTDFTLSQILAGIAFTCGIFSFQQEKRRSILLWMSLAAVVNACHFFILGSPGPGTLYAIMSVRVFTAAFYTDRRLMYLFMTVILAGFYLSYDRPLDILALFAACLATYGNFRTSIVEVRLVYMACAATWIVHNILAGSPVAVLMEATFLTSNVIGYWRFRKK
ncbi:MAG: YgjV family protein [candidate division Zixibacteria bacterium]|nr:YgjV family protein [candidate division Zixibacteria bacterium]